MDILILVSLVPSAYFVPFAPFVCPTAVGDR